MKATAEGLMAGRVGSIVGDDGYLTLIHGIMASWVMGNLQG